MLKRNNVDIKARNEPVCERARGGLGWTTKASTESYKSFSLFGHTDILGNVQFLAQLYPPWTFIFHKKELILIKCEWLISSSDGKRKWLDSRKMRRYGTWNGNDTWDERISTGSNSETYVVTRLPYVPIDCVSRNRDVKVYVAFRLIFHKRDVILIDWEW